MLKLEDISHTYQTGEVETRVLEGVTLEVREGEFLAVMGPSGCGKSTLLNIVGFLDSPSSGSYVFEGEEVARYPEKRLTELRRASIGFVFQSFNLIEDLTAEENVEIGLIYRRMPGAQRRERIADALAQVGLSHRAGFLPKQLSGGQQQRVAVARALVSNPRLILADEPTGSLDSANGDAIIELLTGLNAKGTTLVMVTHSLAYAAAASRVVRMLDGRIVSETDMGL
nr:ABC transporter ATP-binding protein [Asticcacaulis benevestitus]